MATADFDYGKQVNAENLVRLILSTPNRQQLMNRVLAWAKVHGVTPSTVMADDNAVEEVAASLSGPVPDVDDGPQGAGANDGVFDDPA